MTEKSKLDPLPSADVVIVGGGAAGLSAELFLVRARRSTIIFDGGETRIAKAERIHTYLGLEGWTPEAFHGQAIKEINKYGGEIRKGKVVNIEPISDRLFKVYTNEDIIITKTVVLATGMVDILPDIAGLQEGWGKDVHVCPCFTGYELADKALVVFGLPERIGQLGKFLTAWSKNVTLVTRHKFEESISNKLKAAGVKVIQDEVTALLRSHGKLQAILTQQGKQIPCVGVFVSVPMRAASTLARTLCEVDELGFAKTDSNGKTSREGLWVIGNASDPIAHLVHAAAAGSRVGPMVTDYIIEQMLLSQKN